MSAPLYGLVLAGGRSTRMQRDKAALDYHGRTQLERAMALLAPHVERAFVSVRADQRADPLRARFEQIVDTREDSGPSPASSPRRTRYPDAPGWCWPATCRFSTRRRSRYLLRARATRRARRPRTARSHDGLPEPLCAIYEPASRAALSDARGARAALPAQVPDRCRRAAARSSRIRARSTTSTRREEYAAAMSSSKPRSGRHRRRITVQYYALLREQAGRSDGAVVTAARTPRELYEELQRRYPFSLAPEMLRVAINDEFGDWAHAARRRRHGGFIPPVAGG